MKTYFLDRLLLTCVLLAGHSCGQTAINNANLSVSSLAVSPATASIVVGAKVTFSCIATLTPGNSSKDLTNQSTWQSSIPAIATMSGNVATGVSVGTTTITCQDGAEIKGLRP
jgi:uncharacterized membrane protein YbjE (DUF340 family)